MPHFLVLLRICNQESKEDEMKAQTPTLAREPAKRATRLLKAAVADPLPSEFAAFGCNAIPISFAQIPVHPPKERSTVNPRNLRLQILRKLAVGAVNDPLESEADAVAEGVMSTFGPAGPTSDAGAVIHRKCPCQGSNVECVECGKEHDKKLRPKAATTTTSIEAPPIVGHVLSSPGRPLDPMTRRFFEPRFSFDFSNVRVHTGEKAEESADAVNAVAYTVGQNLVFGSGRYLPSTKEGRRLIAHELTHVIQQHSFSGGLASGISDLRTRPEHNTEGGVLLQRQPAAWTPAPAPGATPPVPPPPLDVFASIASQIRGTPAYKALDADHVKLTEEILAEVHKRPQPDQLHFLSKLKELFDTPVNPPDVTTAETQSGTAAAVTAEKARLSKPAEARQTTLEERASADVKRTWVPIKGKFGDGTYYVDRTSPTNIVVKADILLTPKGTGTKKDVDAIKGMEDAIEKAASNKGYIVDIRFVNTAGPDTFKVDVDPSQWEVATNWSGGDPTGFAHELHHLFAFELDRYNYIESHATNKDMQVADRLYWFRKELEKPPNYNDPTSIMNSAAHPNDDDACRVAGLDVATCVPARAAARAAGKL
jgi:Domain of unknown function (DUF4157)